MALLPGMGSYLVGLVTLVVPQQLRVSW